MKNQLNILKCAACIGMLALGACTPVGSGNKDDRSSVNTDTVNLKFTIEEAPEWTALFNRTSGWFGGDGIFAIPLNGKDNVQVGTSTKTMLIFSDTLIGEIENNQLPKGFNMVNNTVAYLTGNEAKKDKINFEWARDTSSKPISLFTPNTPDSKKGDYYWLGDGFVNAERNNTTYIFAHRMRNTDPKSDWSFKEFGTNLIAIPKGSLPPFKDQRQIQTPFYFEDGSFGVGIFVNTKESGALNPDGYIYIYGVKGKERNLAVARALPKYFEDFKTWRFWDGKGWNSDMQKTAFIANGVSNELSVSELPDGRYALIYQHNSGSSKIGLRLGLTPYTSFGPMIEIWDCKEAKQKNYITYNAKGHPSLSAPGELLISYNVNSFDFHNDIKKTPNLYRPRFVKLKFQN